MLLYYRHMKQIIFLIFCIFLIPKTANAVVPPDFVIQVGSQILPIFGWIFTASIAIFSISYNYIKVLFKKRYIIILICVLSIAGVSLGLAFGIDTIHKKSEIARIEEQIVEQQNQYEESVSSPDSIVETDQGVIFIREYYQHISDGELLEAYRMTSQNISFDTFYTWYKDTTRVHIDKLESTGDNTYSIRVVLFEADVVTTFGVLATIENDENGKATRIGATEVAILGNGAITTEDSDFQVINNETFENLISINPEIFVLDAREKIEFEYGHFPASTHIKFADLEDGQWKQLPTNQPIYVLCWSGIRGSMVASFLREQGLDAYYLEDGANGWVANGGIWEGEISFSAVYDQEQYSRVYTQSQFDDLLKTDVFIVDARNPAKFESDHINGSLNIRILNTPTKEMDKLFSYIPPHSSVIALCDDYINCFDARITGIELERLGNIFLGRYIYTGSN